MPTQDIDVIDRRETDTEKKIERPKKYQAVMYNDDFTPFEFVTYVLMRFFDKNADEAVAIMLSVHNSGKGICGVYQKDVCETKASEVMKLAKQEGFPLRVEVEAQP